MRIKDIIERFRIDLRERVKLVRIQLFHDHCERRERTTIKVLKCIRELRKLSFYMGAFAFLAKYLLKICGTSFNRR